MEIKTTQDTLASRKRVRSILLIVFSVALVVAATFSLLSSSNKHNRVHDVLYSKIENYNSELSQTGKKINWKDPMSIRSGLLALRMILDAKAPYLDTFINIIHQSLVLLKPENAIRTSDTLQFIAWHKAYLQNLAYQKESQQLTDSICILFRTKADSTESQYYKSELRRKLTLLFVNDSAVTATHVVEDSLHKRVGSMQMLD
jgi:flagellar basal body-associated protein FliL